MGSNIVIKIGNDEFILYVRKNSNKCSITNDGLGKLICLWLEERSAKKIYGRGAKGLAIVVKLITNLKEDEFPNLATLEEPFDGRLSRTVLREGAG